MAEITKNKNEAGNDPAEEAKKFGAYLRELRKSQKLSQADIAQRIEVTAGYYGIFEQGRQIPSLKIINRLAQALDIDYLELAMRAGYDEFEARKKELYRPKDSLRTDMGDQEGDQGDRKGIDEGDSEDGSGTPSATEAGTIGSARTSNQETTRAPQTSNSALPPTLGGLELSPERLDWAMFCITHDPTYKLADQFKGEISRDIKVLVVQLYQAQTQRQLLTADESMALSYTLHG